MYQNFIQKYYDIIEALQKHFYTMGKYISNDVFVSVTAHAAARAERYRCQVYHFSLTSATPRVAILIAY